MLKMSYKTVVTVISIKWLNKLLYFHTKLLQFGLFICYLVYSYVLHFEKFCFQ